MPLISMHAQGCHTILTNSSRNVGEGTHAIFDTPQKIGFVSLSFCTICTKVVDGHTGRILITNCGQTSIVSFFDPESLTYLGIASG